MNTNTNTNTNTNSREAAQRAALEKMLAAWLNNNPDGSVLRDVEIDEA